MEFKLKTPCGQCPFLKTSSFLTKARVRSITKNISKENKTFQCHKTLEANINAQHCAGALIVLEKNNLAVDNNMIRIAERLGMYNHQELNMEANVYENFKEMVLGHGK